MLFSANPFGEVTEGLLSSWSRRQRFSSFLPYMAYDPADKIYYNRDDSAGFLLSCAPLISGGDKAESALASILGILPPEAVLSVSLVSSPYILDSLREYKRIKVRARENPLLEKVIENYVSFLEQGTQGLPHFLGMPVRDYYVLFSFKLPRSSGKDLFEIRMAAKETLKGCGLFPADVEPISLLRFLFLIFNGHVDENLYWDEGRILSDQVILAETETRVHSDYMQIGENFWKCITPKQIPGQVSLHITKDLTGMTGGADDDSNQIPCHFIFTVVYTYDKGVANFIRTKASFFKKQSEGEDNILNRLIGAYAREHLEAVDNLEKGAKYIYSMPLLWLWSASREKLESAVARTKRLFGSQGYVPQEERGILVPLYISALPFGFYNKGGNMLRLQRQFLAPQKASAALAPVAADYRGGGRPHMLFVSRKGQLVSFDPFDKCARNKNLCVMGTTGGGKSFLLNTYVISMFAAGAVCRIFDLGYSYQKTCKMLGGYYLDLGEKLCLNPFSFVPADSDQQEMNYHLSNIAALIGTMVNADSDEELTQTEKNILKAAVDFAWEDSGPDAEINLIHQYLAKFPGLAGEEVEQICNNESECVRDLSNMAHQLAYNLSAWTSQGDFGSFFNGRATVDLVSSPLIVFEQERIRKVKALLRVVSLAVINATTAVLYLMDREIPKVLIYEECGTTLKGNDLYKAVIEEAYRRGRKNNVSTATVFQSPLDLSALGDVGDVILGNGDFQFFLPSPDYSSAIRKGILPLEGAGKILSSIGSARPRYTELGLKTPYGLGVVRVLVDSYMYWLATSDPEDWTAIQGETRECGGDMVKAIEHMAKMRDEKLSSLFSGL